MIDERKRYVLDSEGRRKDTKSVKLLPPHLRMLPGDLVAKDLADPDRAFETDAPHVIEDIVHTKAEEIKAEDAKPAPKKPLDCAMPGEVVPLRQFEIDVVRMRVIGVLIDNYLEWIKDGEPSDGADHGVRYLWFPEDNVNRYELREGNPPSDTDRPKHMRGFRLECDIESIPEGVHKLLREYGDGSKSE